MPSQARSHSVTLEEAISTAQRLSRDVLAATCARVDAECLWPEESLRALQREGLGGLVIPARLGGSGQGLLALAQVCEALGAECPSTSLCFGMHCVGSAVIAAKATPDQEARFVRPIAEGKHLTTLALSEPGTGVHFYFPQTTLRSEEDGLRVQGSKTFVTNGGHADSYVVSAVAADPGALPGHFSCVVVPADAEGLCWKEQWRGIGMRGNSARTVTLSEVKVPHGNLLGKEGDQIWYVFNVVTPYFIVAMSGTYLGLAARALQETVDHLKARVYQHGAAPPSANAVVQRDLGTMWRTVERTRRLLYHAAAEADAGGPGAVAALCSAKADVAECAVKVTNMAMTLCGGVGYREGGRLERLLRDARAADVMSPTTALLETWVGRATLGLPILGE